MEAFAWAFAVDIACIAADIVEEAGTAGKVLAEVGSSPVHYTEKGPCFAGMARAHMESPHATVGGDSVGTDDRRSGSGCDTPWGVEALVALVAGIGEDTALAVVARDAG
jgi:hypothetical protein